MLPISLDGAQRGAVADLTRDVGRNGTFLVVRQLHQYVETFNDFCEEEAERLKDRLPPPYEVTPEFIGSRMIGRWEDGSSIVRFPYISATEMAKRAAEGKGAGAGEMTRAESVPAGQDQTAIKAPVSPSASSSSGEEVANKSADVKPIRPDNDFLFGIEDPEGVRCPFGSHVRRVNPRDSMSPGSQEQIDIVNRHRILRVGRGYGGNGTPQQMKGLMFMCLNADIERQFEFIQQTWMENPRFHGLSGEKDPIVGDGDETKSGFTIPTRDGPIALSTLKRFTKMLGGGYFFLPSKRLLRYLTCP